MVTESGVSAQRERNRMHSGKEERNKSPMNKK